MCWSRLLPDSREKIAFREAKYLLFPRKKFRINRLGSQLGFAGSGMAAEFAIRSERQTTALLTRDVYIIILRLRQ
jgi:hypothetical protein